MAEEEEEVHVLVLSHPLHGHIAPLLHLSKYLSSSSHSLSISFILTQHSLSRITHPHPTNPRLTFIGLPDGLPPDHPRRPTFQDSHDAVMGMRASTQHLLRKLAHDKRSPACIIADLFVVWSYELASQFHIPCVAFATTNVTVTSIMSYTATLHSMGLLPFEAIGGTSRLPEERITCIPGVMPLAPKDFPESMRLPSYSHYRFQFVLKQYQHIDKHAALLINSFYELETRAVDSAPFRIPVYTIGPTLLLNEESTVSTGMDVSLWPEETICLNWLDKQITSSVLYVSFGSMASMPVTQIREIAFALEANHYPFLWVIRSDSVQAPVSSVLPEEFLNRTKDRGMVVDWAPQLAVLSHPAVGGFITHCGWNSTLENLSLGGLPMICWPWVAEQRTNQRLIVDEWGMGLEMRESEDDGVVERGQIGRVVRELMEGEGAKGMRKRAAQWKDMARAAMAEEGGSSVKNLETFVEKVREWGARASPFYKP